MRTAIGRAIAVMIVLLSAPAQADDARAVDVHASRAAFTVQHVLIERVTGTLPITEAHLVLGSDGVTPTAVEATLDPRRIDTGDSDRDGDLQSADWFDTKRFPVWTFFSTRVVPKAGGTFAVDGTLTVHGVGVPVTLSVLVSGGNSHPAYHATTTVNRHAFGMSVTRTDALVGNDVSIVLDIQTK